MIIYCAICGKPVKASSKMVHMTTGLVFYGPDFSYKVRPSEDQGWFEVGPDCYRRVVAAGAKGFTR